MAQVTVSGAPTWYDQFGSTVANAGGQLAQTPYTAYGGPRIADFNQMQLGAFNLANQGAGIWQQGANQANNTFGQAANTIQQGATFNAGPSWTSWGQSPQNPGYQTQGQIPLTNMGQIGGGGFDGGVSTAVIKPGDPYYTNQNSAPYGPSGPAQVLDTGFGIDGNFGFNQPQQQGGMNYDQFWQTYAPGFEAQNQVIQNIGNRNFTNTTLANLNSNFGGAGGWGGGRHQILGADAAATAQGRIAEAQIGAYTDARGQAMQDYLNWARQSTTAGQAMNQLGQNQAQLGFQQQDALAQDVGMLGGLGAVQQKQDQQNLDLAYNDFMSQQNHPWDQMNKWVSLMKNVQTPNQATTISTGEVNPFTGQTADNPWIAGILGGLGYYNAQTRG
jgi:hypothetical protein